MLLYAMRLYGALRHQFGELRHSNTVVCFDEPVISPTFYTTKFTLYVKEYKSLKLECISRIGAMQRETFHGCYQRKTANPTCCESVNSASTYIAFCRSSHPAEYVKDSWLFAQHRVVYWFILPRRRQNALEATFESFQLHRLLHSTQIYTFFIKLYTLQLYIKPAIQNKNQVLGMLNHYI